MMKTTFDFEFGLTSDHLDGKPISVRPIIDLLMSDMYHDPVEDTTDDGLEVCYCGLCQEIQPALIQVEDYIAALRDQLARAREVIAPLAAHVKHLDGNDSVLIMRTRTNDDKWEYLRYGHLRAAVAWLEEEDGERNE